MQSAYVALWQSVFVFALLLELPLVALAAKGTRVRAVLASLLGNAITHPALWFVWPRVLPATAALLVGEACAIAVEGASIAWLGRQGARRGFVIAAAVNVHSWIVGELVMRTIARRLLAYWFGVPQP